MNASQRATGLVERLDGLRPGDHAGWVVDAEVFEDLTSAYLSAGVEAGDKAVVFGPAGSRLAGIDAFDPASLMPGGFDVSVLVDTIRRECLRARAEGYRALRVMADMDWLIGIDVTPEQMTAFELGADRALAETGGTAVCAYRRDSFADEQLAWGLCPHPMRNDPLRPAFRIWRTSRGWAAAGEIDIATERQFQTALGVAAAGPEPTSIDMGQVDFIGVAGLRALAEAAARRMLVVEALSSAARRSWELLGFGELGLESAS